MNSGQILCRAVPRCHQYLSSTLTLLTRCRSCHQTTRTYVRQVPSVPQCTGTNPRSEYHALNMLNILLQRSSRFCWTQRRWMSGSNKWSKVKQVKIGKDIEKSKMMTNHANKIRAVIRDSPMTDPKQNSALMKLVEEARAKNLTMSSIDSVIASAMKLRDSSTIHTLEGRGIGGSFFIVEVSTDKLTKTKNDLNHLIKKLGGIIAESGAAQHAFNKTGILDVTLPGTTTTAATADMDKFVEIAIEVGAEDVTMETDDEEDDQFLRFVCEPNDLYSVKKALEKKQLELRSFSVDYLNHAPVKLGTTEMELVGKMMEKLEDHPEVMRVFINVEAPES